MSSTWQMCFLVLLGHALAFARGSDGQSSFIHEMP